MQNSKSHSELSASLLELYKKQVELRADYRKRYPKDVPNNASQYAIIGGMRLANDQILSVGDYLPIISFDYENLFVWTIDENKSSLIVSKVSEEVKSIDIWKTSVSILEIMFFLSSRLEHDCELKYHWVYDFSHEGNYDDLHFRDEQYDRELETFTTISLRKIYKHLEILELLISDDRFFVATQNIIQAMKNHQFCQECAYRLEHDKMHKDDEPEPWEYIQMIPSMETAIVNATRAVEAILGKPGKRSDQNKLLRVKKRRGEKIDINCDDTFNLVKSSYLDYYYDLFQERNSAAHSFGDVPFELQRKKAIQAQTFAWEIVCAYYKKNKVSKDEAIDKLSFNIDLYNDLAPDIIMSTETKKK